MYTKQAPHQLVTSDWIWFREEAGVKQPQHQKVTHRLHCQKEVGGGCHHVEDENTRSFEAILDNRTVLHTLRLQENTADGGAGVMMTVVEDDRFDANADDGHIGGGSTEFTQGYT